jgi:hypothetical protein
MQSIFTHFLIYKNHSPFLANGINLGFDDLFTDEVDKKSEGGAVFLVINNLYT